MRRVRDSRKQEGGARLGSGVLSNRPEGPGPAREEVIQVPEPETANMWLKLANWIDRRVVKKLDQAAIGSERVFGDGRTFPRSGAETRRLYEIHGWVQVSVAYHPASKSNIYTFRRVRQADPAEVAKLHQRLGYEPPSKADAALRRGPGALVCLVGGRDSTLVKS
jgi:hypothetical protein